MAEKKVDVQKIKDTKIMKNLPVFLHDAIDTQITDDSATRITSCAYLIMSCNENLGKAMEQMDSYMNNIADEYEKLDKEVGKKISEAFSEVKEQSGSTIKGNNRYSGLV